MVAGSHERAVTPVFRSADPLTVLRGVGDKLAGVLRAAGIRTIRDLVLAFPRRHAERAALEAPDEAHLGELVRIRARVEGTRLAWLPGRRSMVTVKLVCTGGVPLEVRFFNQPYLKNSFAVGSERFAEGVLDRRGKVFQLKQAELLSVEKTHDGPCRLVYAEIPGVSAARFQSLVEQALTGVRLERWRPEALPAALDRDFLPFAAAVRAMHRPETTEQHEAARLRFAVVEAVALFRRLEQRRGERVARQGVCVAAGATERAAAVDCFPFALTGDQQQAFATLADRLAAGRPMGALLQGDVGTGKTAVAIALARLVVAGGYQVALLAPTELLAEQHYAGAQKWLGAEFAMGLLTASRTPNERAELEARLAAGEPVVVFGTHALLSESTVLPRLGLAIIDEQHRFGVRQRFGLVQKGDNPHVLYLTATPIPRTLTYTVFGDLDLVTIRERPPGHRDARAFYLPPKPKSWRRIQSVIERRVARGQQVFVVCPKIGDDDSKGSAVRMHRELAERFDARLVHGRMDAAARQATLDAFRDGEFGVLVGTTVLEVGIDVPNATLIVVVGVDRFGLATLHQLRGRVGRGRRRGVCILTGPPSARVEVICKTTDGFELAERDLILRGAGEILGTRQSGLSDLHALDPVQDLELLRDVRDAVREEAEA